MENCYQEVRVCTSQEDNQRVSHMSHLEANKMQLEPHWVVIEPDQIHTSEVYRLTILYPYSPLLILQPEFFTTTIDKGEIYILSKLRLAKHHERP